MLIILSFIPILQSIWSLYLSNLIFIRHAYPQIHVFHLILCSFDPGPCISPNPCLSLILPELGIYKRKIVRSLNLFFSWSRSRLLSYLLVKIVFSFLFCWPRLCFFFLSFLLEFYFFHGRNFKFPALLIPQSFCIPCCLIMWGCKSLFRIFTILHQTTAKLGIHSLLLFS